MQTFKYPAHCRDCKKGMVLTARGDALHARDLDFSRCKRRRLNKQRHRTKYANMAAAAARVARGEL